MSGSYNVAWLCEALMVSRKDITTGCNDSALPADASARIVN